MPKKKTEKKSPISQIKERSKEKPDEIQVTANEGNFSTVVSTGSTLLDLAISGGRVRGGGVPSGILMEIYGGPGAGKTSVLAEMSAYTLAKGGNVKYLDPEARLDKEYMRIYGMELEKDCYFMPNTVNETFDHILDWEPDDPKKGSVNLIATDSLAALSSELELSADGDKMGMKIAKDFSAGLRKSCVLIKEKDYLIACSNQIRQNTTGNNVTSGGKGIPFYASLRIEMKHPMKNKYLKKSITLNGKKHEKIYGVQSICSIKKSSIDDPYREANVFIVFGHGIDDIRANLAYIKQMTGADKFVVREEKFARVNDAIAHVEENNLELELKNKVIDLWEELQEKFKIPRKPKNRGI